LRRTLLFPLRALALPTTLSSGVEFEAWILMLGSFLLLALRSSYAPSSFHLVLLFQSLLPDLRRSYYVSRGPHWRLCSQIGSPASPPLNSSSLPVEISRHLVPSLADRQLLSRSYAYRDIVFPSPAADLKDPSSPPPAC